LPRKKEKMQEDLRDWFGKSKSKSGKPGWVQADGSPCANEPDDKGKTPKCFSSQRLAKLNSMGKEGKKLIRSAVRRKRKEDKSQQKKSGGEKPTMVRTFTKPEDYKKYPSGDKQESFSIKEQEKQPDHEHSMIRSELETIRKAVDRLKSKMKGEGNVEAWVQSKITKAADYIDSAADYIDSGEHNVHGSMDEAKKDPCWKGYKQVGTKKKGKKEVPNCVPESAVPPAIDPKAHREQQRAKKIRDRTKTDDEGSEIAKKKTKGPSIPMVRKGDTNIRNINAGYEPTLVEKIQLEMEAEVLNEKNVPTNPSLWSKMKARAKAKFDVYPSAYANGWAAKEYKKAGGGWKSVSEEYEEEKDEVCPYCGCDPCECEGVEIEEAVRIPAKTGNLMYVMVTWRGKGYSMKVFFPQLKRPTRKEVEDKMQGVYPGSKVRHIEVIDMKPGEQFLQVSEGAAWTKKEGKSEAGGLNEKGRKSYERENPGSDLKAPSKKVGNKRRASFCARMKGMKKKLTSAKTANDPDSRINKSLRAWNC
jgi:hypothetical protein